MDAEFHTIMVRVIGLGLFVGAVATTALFFAFRAFGPEQRKGSDTRAVVMIAATLGFVILACVVLLLLSPERR